MANFTVISLEIRLKYKLLLFEELTRHKALTAPADPSSARHLDAQKSKFRQNSMKQQKAQNRQFWHIEVDLNLRQKLSEGFII